MIAAIDTKKLEEFGRHMATMFKDALAASVAPLNARIAELEARVEFFKSSEFAEALEASLAKHVLEVAGIKLAIETQIPAFAAELVEVKAALDPLAGRIAAVEEIDVENRLHLISGLVAGVRGIVETTCVELEKDVAEGSIKIEKLEAVAATQETLNIALESHLIEIVKTSVASSVAEIATIKGDKGDTGASVVAAMINRDGALVLTCADGSLRDVGRVVGKDGEAGLGFDDLDVELLGERTLSFVWTRGDLKKEREFVIPWILDKGVFVEGHKYQMGDGVTFGGALWIAQKTTGSKPGHDDSWRLAVKKGRDGRDLRKDEEGSK